MKIGTVTSRAIKKVKISVCKFYDMSLNRIVCTNCGSIDVEEISDNKYICIACKTKFNYDRLNDARIVHDSAAHNCRDCGKDIRNSSRHKCTECKRDDLCDDCADFEEGLAIICKKCLREQGDGCIQCGKSSIYNCNSCLSIKQRNPAEFNQNMGNFCEDHYESWTKKHTRFDELGAKWGISFSCPNCNDICKQCALEKKGMFNKSKYYCKNCNSEVRTKDYVFMD